MFDSTENELVRLIRLAKDSSERKGKMGSLPARLQWSDADLESVSQILNCKGLPKPRITLSWGEGVLETALERAKTQAERERWERQMQQQQQMMQQQMMPQMQQMPPQMQQQQQMPDIAALVNQAVAAALAAQASVPAPAPAPEPAPEAAPEAPKA